MLPMLWLERTILKDPPLRTRVFIDFLLRWFQAPERRELLTWVFRSVASLGPMKALHRKELYGWSRFDEARNLDFHSVLWVRLEGNVVFDPLPLSAHDASHLRSLGGVAWVVLTNSEHVRAARELVADFGAKLAGPRAEADTFPLKCDRWLSDGELLLPGLLSLELHGSKTPGELAFLLEDTTLVMGDLVRGHLGGRLNLLPDAKLKDPARARASVRGLLAWPRIDAVLVGDGWPVFRGGRAVLEELVASLSQV